MVPAPKPGGRPAKYNRRDILNAVFYVLRSGCLWRMSPHDFPAWDAVYGYLRHWQKDGTWQHSHVYLLPDQIRKRFNRTKVRGKAVYRLSLTAAVANELGADYELNLTPEKVLAIKSLMVNSSPLSGMAADAKKVFDSANDAIKASHDFWHLEELIHQASIAKLKIKSADQQTETLKACMTLLEKHGLVPSRPKQRTRK